MTIVNSLVNSVVDTVVAKASTVVPIDRQIQGVHLFLKAKRRVFKGKPIPEFTETPLPDVSTLAIEDIDLFLTPLLGCGTSGIRLGYGGGFYDRVFANASGFRLGVGFDIQRVADWPVETHDQRLNGYLSESGLVLFD